MTKGKFYRIHIEQCAYYTKRPKGLFVAIGNLVDQGLLSPDEVEEYWRNRRWYEANLPIPPFYEGLNPQHPVTEPILPITWYKNNEQGNDMFAKMEFYFSMAEKYNRQLYVTSTDVEPGEVVYEDDFQIAVVNSKHSGPGFTTVLFKQSIPR